MSARFFNRSTGFFLWLALLAGLVHTPTVLAQACTTAAAGNWATAGTWNAPCNVAGGPVAGNTVTINHNVTVAAAATVGAVTLVSAGITLQVNAVNFIVNGATNVSGAITHPALGGTHRYTGLVTINAGGSWTNAGNNPVNFRGGIAHGGATFNNGTGTVTFTTAGQTISGGSAMTFGGDVTITGAIVINRTNTNTITIAGTLNGSAGGSTWTNAAGVLNYADTSSTQRPMLTGVLNANTAANTVRYGAAGAQDIDSNTYRTLELSGSGAKTAVGAITVNGDMTWLAGNSATFTPGNFTHIFQGNWVVNTTAGTPLALPTTTSIIRFAPPTVAAATSISGTSAATLTFGDLDITNTSGVTFNENVTVSAGTSPTLTVAAATTLTVGAGMTLTIGTGATATPNATAIIAGATGTLTGTGTVQVTRTAAMADFNTQYSVNTKTLTNLTVEYVAASAQTVSALTYNNLIANNAAGLTLAGNATVNGVLTFTLGDITTGAANTLTIGASGSTAGTPGTTRHVIGNMAKAFSATGSFTYTVGDGTNYTPLALTFYTLPTPGSLTVSVTSGDHPNTTAGTSLIRNTQGVNRYWTLKNSTLAGVFSGTATYVAGDLDAAASYPNFSVSRGATCTSGPRNCASWAIQSLGAPAPSATQITATAMSMTSGAAESDLAVGEPTLPRAMREKEFIFTREMY